MSLNFNIFSHFRANFLLLSILICFFFMTEKNCYARKSYYSKNKQAQKEYTVMAHEYDESMN